MVHYNVFHIALRFLEIFTSVEKCSANGGAQSINPRIYPRFQMQTEKSQLEGKRIMLGTSYRVSALSVDPRVGISLLASETNVSITFNYI